VKRTQALSGAAVLLVLVLGLGFLVLPGKGPSGLERSGAAAQARFEANFRIDQYGGAVGDELRRLAEARQLRQVGAAFLGQRERVGDAPTEYKPPESMIL